MPLTEDDLRHLLREGAERAPLVPTAQLVAGFHQPRRRRIHRSGWAAAGVTATVAVVAAVGAVEGSGTSRPAPRLAAPLVGPVVTEIPNSARTDSHIGNDWTAIAFGDSRHAWAAGTDCTSDAVASCHVIAATSDDGGATWRSVAAPSVPVEVEGMPLPLRAHGAQAFLGMFTSVDGGASWGRIAGFDPEAGGSDQYAYLASTFQNGSPAFVSRRSAASQGCDAVLDIHVLDGPASRVLASVPVGTSSSLDMGEVTPDGTVWLQTSGVGTPPVGCANRSGDRYRISPAGEVTRLPADGWQFLAAVDDRTAFFASTTGSLGETTDGGLHVKAIPSLPGWPAIADGIRVRPFTTEDLLFERVVDGGTVADASTDGGRTSERALATGNDISGEVTVIDASDAAIVDSDGNLYRSDDAGRTWHKTATIPS